MRLRLSLSLMTGSIRLQRFSLFWKERALALVLTNDDFWFFALRPSSLAEIDNNNDFQNFSDCPTTVPWRLVISRGNTSLQVLRTISYRDLPYR